MRFRINPCVQKIPWRRKWQPTSVSLPEKFHGQRSLMAYSPWGHKESGITEQLQNIQFPRFSFVLILYILASLHGTMLLYHICHGLSSGFKKFSDKFSFVSANRKPRIFSSPVSFGFSIVQPLSGCCRALLPRFPSTR